MKKIARNTAEILFACKNDLLETDIQQEKFDSIEKSTPINAEDLQPEIDFPVDKNELIVDLSSDKDLQPKQNGSDKKSIFLQKLEDYDLESDQDGIFQIMQGSKLYITNFSQVEFLYRKIQDEVINRVFSFDGISIELSPSDLMSKSSFNKKLLGCSCFRVDLSKDSFPSFINLLLSLDDGKIVENTSGFGQVTPEIFHLGNKVIINGSPSNFETPIWIGTKGFALKQTDTIKVSEDSDEFHNIWSNFHGLYGMQAILILGFAVATLFFQQLLNSRKFPLLYIRAASGRGKSCLAGFLCSLFGLNESFATINCAGNSTKIGIESKSLLLNNLPMILNEATEDNFNYMKSRFDGQGSVKFHRDKLGNILERSVKGPIVATTVVEPFDKQMVSRCVFIDLDKIIMNKKLYDEVQSKIEMLSCFATEILQNVSFDDLLKEVDKFTKTMSVDLKEPRILDNYCLLAGSFMVFKSFVRTFHCPQMLNFTIILPNK